MVTDDEYLYFADRALDGMAAILTELGDELANRRPDLLGANSPYAIVNHCLGVVDYWVGRSTGDHPRCASRRARLRRPWVTVSGTEGRQLYRAGQLSRPRRLTVASRTSAAAGPARRRGCRRRWRRRSTL